MTALIRTLVSLTFFGFSVFMPPTLASTPVSGTIAQSTTWTAANSPYLVSGPVIVSNQALLTIEPGVQVLMSAGASLEIAVGALSAQGLSDQPIVITSSNDVTGSSIAAIAGDWGSLVFDDGTIDKNTILSNVQIRYGHGIVIQSASPTFSNVSVNDHIGPAFSIDLNSSPVGHGLTASGNTINGIAVPAGEIDQNVTWAMTGIPYVVQQGIVNVGQYVFGLSPAHLRMTQGAAATIELAIPTPAPSAGTTAALTNSVPSVASAPPIVTVPADAKTAMIAVNGLSLGSTTITASLSGYSNSSTVVDVIAAPRLTLTPNSGVVGVGRSLTMTLSLSDVAPNGGRIIQLANSTESIATLPASVFIPAGAQSVTFQAQGLTTGTATITASASGYTNVTAQLSVHTVALSLPSGVVTAPNLSTQATLTLSDPAPSDGLSITLTGANTAITTVPATLSVPAGATSIDFNITGVAAGSTSVTASAAGYNSASMSVTVDTIDISLNPSSISVPQGLSTTISYAQLSKPAPSGGVIVNLATGDAGIATVAPVSVTVPQGSSSSSSSAILTGVTTGTTQLTGSSAGLTSTPSTVTVTSPASLAFNTASLSVGKGLTSNTYLYLSYSSSTPVTVTLTSSDPSKVSVPATLTIPGNAGWVSIPITGVDLTTSGVTIDASASCCSSPVTKLSVTVVMPQLQFINLDTNRSTTNGVDDFYLQWSSSGVAATSQTFTLSIQNANPNGIVPGFVDSAGEPVTQITIPAGQSYSPVVYVAQPITTGTYQVGASLTDIGNWTSSIATVGNAELRISSAITVHKGFVTYSSVAMYANGKSLKASNALTATLTNSDPSKVQIPATITIPAGYSSASFAVTGLGVTSSAVTVNASAACCTSPTKPLSVTVLMPELQFINLDSKRSISSPVDDFYLQWPNYGEVTAISQTFTLSVDSANPSGIVPGFVDNTGKVLTEVTIPIGSTSSPIAYVAKPTTTGTYQVKATTNGDSWTSSVATVGTYQLGFSSSTATVGKGLMSSASVNLYFNGQSITTPAALTVNLVSSDASKVTVPATLTIPANASYASFELTGIDVTSNNAMIDASATSYSSPTTKLGVAVVTPQLEFNNLDTNRSITSATDDFYIRWYVPNAGSQPAATTQTVTLSVQGAAPSGIVPGFVDNTGKPITQVTIPAGQTSSGTAYVAQPVTEGIYQVGASVAGIGSGTSNVVSVGNPELRFSTSSITVGKGLQTSGYVQLYVNGQVLSASKALTVSLTNSDPAKASVPASITIAAGYSSANFTVAGVDLTSSNVIINASAPGYAVPTTPLSVTVVTPQLQFINFNTSRGTNNTKDDFYLRWYVAEANQYQAAATAQTINLTIQNDDPTGIVPGFVNSDGNSIAQVAMAAGQSNSPTVYVAAPISAGTYQAGTSLAGVGSWTSSTVTVGIPELRFSRSTLTANKSFTDNSTYLSFYLNGQQTYPQSPLTITLTSSDPSKASVPTSVTLSSWSVNVPVTGVDLTTDQVAIDAIAPGYASPTTKLNVTVIEQQIQFEELNTSPSTASGPNYFYLQWSSKQPAATDQTFTLSVQAANPSGIVPGFVDSSNNIITQVTIRAGRYYSDSIYAAAPTTTGTYQIQAELDGVGSWRSDTVTVGTPKLGLRFSGYSNSSVGKGLMSSRTIELTSDGDYTINTDDVIVTLTNSDPSKVTVPATVTIPAGTGWVYIPVTGVDLTSTAVTIDASAPGYASPTNKMTINVVPAYLQFNMSTSRSITSAPASLALRWYELELSHDTWTYYKLYQAPAIDQTFALSIKNANPSEIVTGFVDSSDNPIDQLTYAAGQTTSSTVYVPTPTAVGTYQVNANLDGVDFSSTVTVTGPLQFNYSTLNLGKGLVSPTVQISRNGVSTSAALTINLNCIDTDICNVPATVTIPAGQTAVSFTVTSTEAGSTQITATATDYLSPLPINVSVVAPTLQLTGPAATLDVGQSSNVQAALYLPPSTSAQKVSANTIINLSSLDPIVATVSASVIIPANGTLSFSVPVQAVGAGSTTITASGTDLVPVTSPAITVH